MSIEITLLGTGSPLPNPDRAGPATLVRAGDATLLVDCGRGVVMRLTAAGVLPMGLSAVLLTHLHSDHITDLNDIITTHWVMSPGPTTLHVYGPAQTQLVVDGILAMLAPDLGYRVAHHADLTWTPIVEVHEVAPQRYVAYLPGPHGSGPQLRLVSGDHRRYADLVTRALENAVGSGPEPARVTLVGVGHGGVTAVDIAVRDGNGAFVVDQVVTVGAPAALVPRIPDHTRVLSLELRTDPVALLGSLLNAGADNRLTVVFDGGEQGSGVYVDGARAADAANHPALREAMDRLRGLGFLASD